MGIRDQLKTVKENWLIVIVLLVIVILPLLSPRGTIASWSETVPAFREGSFVGESAVARVKSGYYPSPVQGDFAPEVTDRKITRTASLSQEVERGYFQDANLKVKSIVASTDSFLLHENIYRSGHGRNGYYTGTYQVKVEAGKYDAVVAQLKEIGTILSFSENTQDITGTYTNLEVELAAEKARLRRYQEIYQGATTVTEKMEVSDRIFNQERTIKYLEDALKNMDRQVVYSTISLQLQEKQSGYAGIVFAGFAELVARLVKSMNGVLQLLFWALPYAAVAIVVWLVVRKVRKKKK